MSLTDIFTGVGNFLEGAEDIVKQGQSVLGSISGDTLKTNIVPEVYTPMKSVDTSITSQPATTGTTQTLATGNSKMMLVIGGIVLLLLLLGGGD